MTDDITLDAPETRLERFLAAAAGVEGITLDEPETRIEKYLYKIAQGGGSGGGGGALVVHMDENSTLDKTWNEINAADVAVIVYSNIEDGKTYHMRELVVGTALINGNYLVRADGGESDNAMYKTDSADGYPVNPVLQQ